MFCCFLFPTRFQWNKALNEITHFRGEVVHLHITSVYRCVTRCYYRCRSGKPALSCPLARLAGSSRQLSCRVKPPAAGNRKWPDWEPPEHAHTHAAVDAVPSAHPPNDATDSWCHHPPDRWGGQGNGCVVLLLALVGNTLYEVFGEKLKPHFTMFMTLCCYTWQLSCLIHQVQIMTMLPPWFTDGIGFFWFCHHQI